MAFNDDNMTVEYFDDVITIELQRKRKVLYHAKVFALTSVEKEYSSQHGQNSLNDTKKLKKAMITDVSNIILLEPPMTARLTRKYVPVKKGPS